VPRRLPSLLLAATLLALSLPALGEINEDQTGAWYMYFFDGRFGDSRWGLQGDLQYRDWELLGDTEQLLLRTGLTWRPRSNDALLTLGIANITTGAFGEDDTTVNENRLYQEAALPHRVGRRMHLRHRFRYEQRWIDDQDFRTRYRYGLFVNVPLNGTEIGKGTWYLSAFNELFINGEKNIGGGRRVERFDRNRFYLALGHGLAGGLRLQGGLMVQTTDDWSKRQLQLSLHHAF